MKQDAVQKAVRVRPIWASRAIVYSLSAVSAVLVALLAPHWVRGSVRVVAEFDAAALTLLIGFFIFAFHDDHARTRARAGQYDPGRNAVLLITLLSVAAGLCGAIAILGKGPDVHTNTERYAAVALAIAAAVIGWCVTHASYALRYAHLYYRNDGSPGDGLIFPQTPNPTDYDFLYFAFVIGMTFQVSDVQVTDAGIRKLVLMHGLVSFSYNVAIFALGVNLLSSLIH